jgi:hypothetical protein
VARVREESDEAMLKGGHYLWCEVALARESHRQVAGHEQALAQEVA